MLNQIEATLQTITTQFADTRLQLCQVAVTDLADHTCTLSGQVLDPNTLDLLTGRLAAAFPQVSWDTGQVQVLRHAATPSRTVATNLTGLYAQPSFLSEMVSQLFQGWSLQILQEKEAWCFVRQPDGYLGWVYRSYLADVAGPVPTHLVAKPISLLRAQPAAQAELATRLLAGTAVQVLVQQDGWSQLELPGGPTGWLPAADLRPLQALPAGESARRRQMIEDGCQFIGVPYFWGGCSALGIDCSGLAQLLHRLSGVTIPRDADMQFAAGRPVEPPFQPGDLLFFGRAGDHRDISHVAISLGDWRILHASRAINGVYVDDVQVRAGLRDRFVGARSFC